MQKLVTQIEDEKMKEKINIHLFKLYKEHKTETEIYEQFIKYANEQKGGRFVELFSKFLELKLKRRPK